MILVSKEEFITSRNDSSSTAVQKSKSETKLVAESILLSFSGVLDEERGLKKEKQMSQTLWDSRGKEFQPPPYQNINSILTESKSLITCIDSAAPRCFFLRQGQRVAVRVAIKECRSRPQVAEGLCSETWSVPEAWWHSYTSYLYIVI